MTTTPARTTLRRGGLTLRLATIDDATFAADLWTALRPDAPSDPLVTRYWWEVGSSNWSVERFVVERRYRSLGYAAPRAEQRHFDRGLSAPIHKFADVS